MTGQPLFDLRRFVGAGIIDNQVEVELGGRLPIKGVEESDKLFGPVARFALSHHLAIEHIQSGIEVG